MTTGGSNPSPSANLEDEGSVVGRRSRKPVVVQAAGVRLLLLPPSCYPHGVCGLCQLQHVFGDPLQGANTVDTVRKRALKVKRLIRLHEKRIAVDRKLNKPECQDTVKRLEDLRVEQFELSRNL